MNIPRSQENNFNTKNSQKQENKKKKIRKEELKKEQVERMDKQTKVQIQPLERTIHQSWSADAINLKKTQINPKTIGIDLKEKSDVWIIEENGRTIVHYTFNKQIEKIQKAVQLIGDFVKTTKKPNLFCNFTSRSEKNKITIMVDQENGFISTQKYQHFDQRYLIKDLLEGFLELMKAKNKNQIKNYFKKQLWELVTQNSITLGRTLKINLIQGILQNKQKQKTKTLRNLLDQSLNKWNNELKITNKLKQQYEKDHLFDQLDHTEYVQQNLKNILDGHPLLLSSRQKRILIHDVNDQWEFVTGKYFSNLLNPENRLALRNLNELINRQAYLQDIDNYDYLNDTTKEQHGIIYSWISSNLQKLVDEFEKSYNDYYDENTFKGHLRFIRNLLYHSFSYKKILQERFSYQHQNADQLLQKIELQFPKILPFLYEVNLIMKKIINPLKVEGTSLNTSLQFLPKPVKNLKKKMQMLRQSVCPHFLNQYYCKNINQCEYFHPNQSCPDRIEGRNCQNSECTNLYHHPNICLKQLQECNCLKMHLPICQRYYHKECKVSQCSKRIYHPPMGICYDWKKDQYCKNFEQCLGYHAREKEIPPPPYPPIKFKR